MESIVRVFLATGESKAVRYDQETTVERVLQVVLKGIGIGDVAHPHFTLRLLAGLISPLDSIWLHPNLLIRHVRSLYSNQIPQNSAELRFELRLRFVPQSSYELLLTESKAFFYLHEQVFTDFRKQIAWKIPLETALDLAALRVAREYVEKQAKNCIEPKIDLDAIDAEATINTFVPDTVMIKANVKAKDLKKQFLGLVKRFASLSTTDSVLRSLSLLLEIVRFDVEIFKTSIGAGWTSPVDLLVGPEMGLSYRINERCDISRLGELRCVLEIAVRMIEPQIEKAIVQLRLSGSAQPLLITTPSLPIAESLAHLIDGYQMMYNQGPSVYKMKGLERCESLDMKTVKTSKTLRNEDTDLRIKREHVTLKELIGGGQFGNVYKGVYSLPGDLPQAVAIKVCKLENEPADTQLILQESHLMRHFRHENIVSLIGVCAESPMWLVIELAPLGELKMLCDIQD
ncbi:unnamed protein product, partial [Mesorhabditis belari]|uniref:Uncharacterized protein n=1 Tax=Mesorhabditis belari TaxID=2138241 RepID=A0AAF3EG81_9BILA